MAEARVLKPTILALFFLLIVEICHTTIIRERNDDRYIVVFDAGSLDTTAHVFRFDENSNLLKINGNLTTQFSLTDELLLVGEEQLNKILREIRYVFSKSPLLYKSDWIKVLDGAEQGVYLWATVNYLLENLRGDYSDTVSVLDQERTTVETTYAISKEAAKEAEREVTEKNYITSYYFNGTEYDLYSHGYLGYGAYAARGEILKDTNDSYTYCVINDYNVQYDYYGVVYNVRAAPSGPNYEKCKANVLKALNLNVTCDVKNCTFNGVWNGGGGAGVKNLYLTGGFYQTGADLDIVNHTHSAMRLIEYRKVAEEACTPKSLEEASKLYPNVYSQDLPYLCMDFVYLYILLVDGFAIEPTKLVTAVKEVRYGDSYQEVSWPLGAALEIISLDHTWNHI
ncbi:hypothetical protein LUZ60_015484 [Juncus effusus]|nr:hypothetical protein LUZ60_015484 [Juncus effusus]